MFAKSKVSQSMIDAVNKVLGEEPVEQKDQLLSETAPLKEPTPTGMRVYGGSYGNSAKAKKDQTKSPVDNLKGPKDKEMKEGREFTEKLLETVRKSDVPAYLRKAKGDTPLTVADVKAPKKDSISAPENLAKARNEEVDIDEADTIYVQHSNGAPQKVKLTPDMKAAGKIYVQHPSGPQTKVKIPADAKKSIKEEDELDEDNLDSIAKKHGMEFNRTTYGAGMKHPAKGEVSINRYGEWNHYKAGSKSSNAHGDSTGNFASLDKHLSTLNEESKQIDELSKSTLGSYVKKASVDRVRQTDKMHAGTDGQNAFDRDDRRSKGIPKAIDRLTKEEMYLDEQINEVLSKDASAGDWIHDFIHSDNPKFVGKSKAERKKMALGAYYGAQKEEADITTDTLAGRTDGGKDNSFKKFKVKLKGDGIERPMADKPESTPSRASIKSEEVEFDEVLDEAVSRKDFQMVADLIKTHDHPGKRKELAQHHAEIFSKQNPRFDHAKFMKAAGVNEATIAGTPGWKVMKKNVKDKSGAVHTPMSRAKDLARQAFKTVSDKTKVKEPK